MLGAYVGVWVSKDLFMSLKGCQVFCQAGKGEAL